MNVPTLKVTKLSAKQGKGLLKVAAYLAASAVVSYILTLTTDNPEFFGPITPLVNLGLVALRDMLREEK